MVTPVREAPALSPCGAAPDPSFPPVPNEPILALDDIQGNIIGFNKDAAMLIALRITDVAACKRWLATQIPFIATACDVLAFNRLFKQIRSRRQRDTRALQSVWVNIAFSFAGLSRLRDDADAFTDEAFKAGMAARSGLLGDPTDPDAEGNPAHWVIGGADTPAHILLIVAGDHAVDVASEVVRIRDSLAGVAVTRWEPGATLPDPLRGHEHFGFLDGVSQPGLRGRISASPTDVLFPRQNPKNRTQGKPGQDLLWPGAFVFDYQTQTPAGDDPGPVAVAGPAWATHGSFLVYRRLRQDVAAFHAFVDATAAQLRTNHDLVGAQLVGRWASGAPLLRAATADDKELANDECANNNFDFQAPTAAILAAQGAIDCTDAVPDGAPNTFFPPSPGDPTGAVCPFSGHIRKAYARDDIPNIEHRRLLRRGIPFGPPFDRTPGAQDVAQGNRGLLFLAYQTSIVNQFEYVTRSLVNNPDSRQAGAGHDPIIGQNNVAGQNRQRQFQVNVRGAGGNPQQSTLTTTQDWVIPTGGEYLFSPSMAALAMLAGS